MIKNICELSIERYGFLPKEHWEKDATKYNSQKIYIDSTEMNAFYMDPLHSTYLNVIEGTALLYVSLTLGGPYEAFLLDKDVQINHHVYYLVVPLYQHCKIQITYLKATTEQHQYVSGRRVSSTLNKEMHLTEIYTLFYQEFDETFDYKGEIHDFWELTYVDQGELETVIDGVSYVLRQGQFIFYGPNQFHTQKNNKPSPVSFLTLSFGLKLQQPQQLLNHVHSTNREIDMLLKKIIEEKDLELEFKVDLLLSYLKILIIKVLRGEKKGEAGLNKVLSSMHINTSDTVVDDVLTYMHNHIDQKISVDELARVVSLSPSYLSQTFKQVMGTSIMKYLNQYRLEQSKHYIKTTDLSLTQIADILGFGSLHYYSRQFKNAYDISPSAYSRSIRK